MSGPFVLNHEPGPAHGLGRHQTVQPHAPEEYESWVNGLTGSIDMSDIADLSDAKLEKAAHTCPVHQTLQGNVELPMDFVYPDAI